MIYVNNAELEKIFGSSSNITFSTVQVELFLLLTPDESSSEEIVLYLLWISAEGKAQCFQRIKLLVSKEHIDARNQYCRVFGQKIHTRNT